MYYRYNRPHIFKRRERLEIFNEMAVMVANYHMIMYSDYVTENKVAFFMGYTLTGTLLTIVFVNISIMILNNIDKYRRKKKIDKLRQHYETQWTLYHIARKQRATIRKQMKKERKELIVKHITDRMVWPDVQRPIIALQKFAHMMKKAEEIKVEKEAKKLGIDPAEYKKRQAKKALKAKKTSILKDKKKTIEIMKKMETIKEEDDEEMQMYRLQAEEDLEYELQEFRKK